MVSYFFTFSWRRRGKSGAKMRTKLVFPSAKLYSTIYFIRVRGHKSFQNTHTHISSGCFTSSTTREGRQHLSSLPLPAPFNRTAALLNRLRVKMQEKSLSHPAASLQVCMLFDFGSVGETGVQKEAVDLLYFPHTSVSLELLFP